MANDIQKLYDLPDISFIDDISFDELKEEILSDWSKKYNELTGKSKTLREGDEEYIHLMIEAGQYYQMYQIIDRAAKMNLLKYSSGDYLRHLGAFKNTFIQESKSASLTARFVLSEVRKDVITIPKGTRITSGDNIYFETDEYAEIESGEKYIDVKCTCQTSGTNGNGYAEGQINIIVDPIPYVESVTNITKSDGGSDRETEEKLRERIFLAPSSFSVAGPPDAYEYWVKQYNSAAISDVKIFEPEDAIVDIRILLVDGELPSETFCDGCLEYLKNNPIIPLTDKDIVSAPDVVKYNLKAKYYISKNDVNNIEAIKESVESAKRAYIGWQKEKIGRDINPDALTEYVRAAGGKRIEIESPVFTRIPETSIAVEENVEFIYGGMEDD